MGALRTGSSPRVRGTPSAQGHDESRGRFIPACAGNAEAVGSRLRGRAVHPRVCGERGVSVASVEQMDGSSPRVRGTRERFRVIAVSIRFIPACAGNASASRRRLLGSTVHPRVCGERATTQQFISQMGGSSPRVRGTRLEAHRILGLARFIPACAGNAAGTDVQDNSVAVHPRVCGERGGIYAMNEDDYGSSPRVRGTLNRSRELGSR